MKSASKKKRLAGSKARTSRSQTRNQAKSSIQRQALSDLLVNQIGEEELNTVTDPLLKLMARCERQRGDRPLPRPFASTAGENGSSGEIAGAALANPFTEAGTLSNVTVGPNRYYINNVFNLADGAAASGTALA